MIITTIIIIGFGQLWSAATNHLSVCVIASSGNLARHFRLHLPINFQRTLSRCLCPTCALSVQTKQVWGQWDKRSKRSKRSQRSERSEHSKRSNGRRSQSMRTTAGEQRNASPGKINAHAQFALEGNEPKLSTSCASMDVFIRVIECYK